MCISLSVCSFLRHKAECNWKKYLFQCCCYDILPCYKITLTLPSSYMWPYVRLFFGSLILFTSGLQTTNGLRGGFRQPIHLDRAKSKDQSSVLPTPVQEPSLVWACLTEPMIGALKHAKSGHWDCQAWNWIISILALCVHTSFWLYQHWSKEVNNSARETGREPMKHQNLPHHWFHLSFHTSNHLSMHHSMSLLHLLYLLVVICILSLSLVSFKSRLPVFHFRFICRELCPDRRKYRTPVPQ